MEDKENFLKQMENLQVPDVNPPDNQKMIKLAILNASRSAVLGVWLIVVPCYFLLCVFMFYYFHIKWGVFGAMFELMVALDRNPVARFLSPLLLVVLPLVGVVVNALAIIHVQYAASLKELIVTIKLKVWNVLLILFSLVIVGIFISYIIVENIHYK